MYKTQQASAALDSFATWTRDLGTEAAVTRASTHLCHLFGPWVRQQDAAILWQLKAAEGEDSQDDHGFAFQAEGAASAGLGHPAGLYPDDFVAAIAARDPYIMN